MTARAMPIFDGTALFYVTRQSHSGSFLGALSSSAPTIIALSKNAMPAMYAIFQRRQAVGVGSRKRGTAGKIANKCRKAMGFLFWGVLTYVKRQCEKPRPCLF
jgi:hypothetical protein